MKGMEAQSNTFQKELPPPLLDAKAEYMLVVGKFKART